MVWDGSASAVSSSAQTNATPATDDSVRHEALLIDGCPESTLLVDVKDSVDRWTCACVVQVAWFADGPMVLVSFTDWDRRYDEWLPLESHRLAPAGCHTPPRYVETLRFTCGNVNGRALVTGMECRVRELRVYDQQGRLGLRRIVSTGTIRLPTYFSISLSKYATRDQILDACGDGAPLTPDKYATRDQILDACGDGAPLTPDKYEATYRAALTSFQTMLTLHTRQAFNAPLSILELTKNPDWDHGYWILQVDLVCRPMPTPLPTFQAPHLTFLE